MEGNRRHFTAIVAGEDHASLMKQFDGSVKVDTYTVLKYEDREKYRQEYLNMYKGIVDGTHEGLSQDVINEYIDMVAEIEEESAEDFFDDISEPYEIDEETGDAVSDRNPNGKFDFCRVGKELSMPLIDKDGNETFSAKKSDINWDAINGANKETYEIVWDMVMGERLPENDEEDKLYQNMKNRVSYFETFGNRERYVASNTAFWGYAFVSKDGWKELEGENQFDWIINFYDRFIKELPDAETITVYECYRK